LSEQRLISVGKISGVFGIKGWVKVFSYTQDRANILHYSPWLLKKANESKRLKVIDGNLQGNVIIAQLEDVCDRDQAASLMGWDIFITPEQLPKAASGEYYWSDLVGLKVENIAGVDFGVISDLLETGANDVMIVHGDKERCIPFLQGQTIINIDLNAGKMLVDWDADF
jgi:16S rRNA processing protein RimM